MVKLIKKTYADVTPIKEHMGEFEMFVDMLNQFKDQSNGKMNYAL